MSELISVYIDVQGEFYVQSDGRGGWVLHSTSSDYKRRVGVTEIQEYIEKKVVRHYSITPESLDTILDGIALANYPAFYNPHNW